MKNNRLLLLSLIASLMLACNMASLTTPPTPIVVVITQIVDAPTQVPQQAAATEAPTLPPPTEAPPTPTVVLSTPTPSVPMVTPLKDPVNCRFGPSVKYEQISALPVGGFANITGMSSDGGWWQVQIDSGNGPLCWVADSVVISSGDLSGVVAVPAPDALITNVKFRIKPDSLNVGPGCVGPFKSFSLTGTISVNGPVDVNWHFNTQHDGRLGDHTIKFSEFGTQDISFDYLPSTWEKGSYWVRLVITSPKSMLSEVTYEVKCE